MEKPRRLGAELLAHAVQPVEHILGRGLHGVEGVVEGPGEREPREARAHRQGRTHTRDHEFFGELIRQTEQIGLVGAVAVQEDQEWPPLPLIFGDGPEDRGFREGWGVKTHGSYSAITS